MTEDTYAKVAQIADDLLGKEGMHKYPLLLLVGLLCIAFSLRKHRTTALRTPTSNRMPSAVCLRRPPRRSMTHTRLATEPQSR